MVNVTLLESGIMTRLHSPGACTTTVHISTCIVVYMEHREKKSETQLYLAGNNYLVSDQRLCDNDVEVLCEALSANTYVTALDLRYNDLTDVAAKHIAQLLSVRVTAVLLLNICQFIRFIS